jgi:hypothetical protein
MKKIQVKLSLYLIQDHPMETDGGVGVLLHALLTSVNMEACVAVHVPVALP